MTEEEKEEDLRDQMRFYLNPENKNPDAPKELERLKKKDTAGIFRKLIIKEFI